MQPACRDQDPRSIVPHDAAIRRMVFRFVIYSMQPTGRTQIMTISALYIQLSRLRSRCCARCRTGSLHVRRLGFPKKGVHWMDGFYWMKSSESSNAIRRVTDDNPDYMNNTIERVIENDTSSDDIPSANCTPFRSIRLVARLSVWTSSASVCSSLVRRKVIRHIALENNRDLREDETRLGREETENYLCASGQERRRRRKQRFGSARKMEEARRCTRKWRARSDDQAGGWS
ncbi:hypothetical protein BZA05DRAFT_241972 [Tricharina praecox]|uniref:uncharacterized protein n=1 Tax=Tricharina praecox TaxID=43433 RepID=UPI002220587D|nr:uncharacterized protein BZA05DRAFT_241972 [Tricharina praecox]KAI5855524.1 hypothetical protein BZA05DRAFT_241972 [Tricharina praecox]